MSEQPPRIRPCPTCKRPVNWAEPAPFRPFCSERCRLIDLGEWFDENHRIAAEEPMRLPGDDAEQADAGYD